MAAFFSSCRNQDSGKFLPDKRWVMCSHGGHIGSKVQPCVLAQDPAVGEMQHVGDV